jgi:hypothetical protein
MRKDDVRGPADALAYLVDCQLATVSHVVGKRSSPQCDIKRHISIAQMGVDWMRAHSVNFEGTRAEDVVRLCQGRVEDWAQKFRA